MTPPLARQPLDPVAPIYTRLGLSSLSNPLTLFVAAAGALFLGLAVNRLLGVPAHMPLADLQVALIVFISFFGVWVLNFVRRRTLPIVAALAEESKSHDFRRRLSDALSRMYADRYVLPTSLLFGIFVVYRFLLFDFSVPTAILVYFSVCASLTGLIAGLGLWCAIASIGVVYTLRHCDSITYYVIAPARSTSVRDLSRLMNTYSIFFAIEILPVVIAYLIMSGQLLEQGIVSPSVMRMSTTIVLVFLVVVVPAYFLLPQLILALIVGRARRSLLMAYHAKINHLLASEDPEAWKAALPLVDLEGRLAAARTFPYRFTDSVKPLVPLVGSIALVVIKEFGPRVPLIKSLQTLGRHILPGLIAP